MTMNAFTLFAIKIMLYCAVIVANKSLVCENIDNFGDIAMKANSGSTIIMKDYYSLNAQ